MSYQLNPERITSRELIFLCRDGGPPVTQYQISTQTIGGVYGMPKDMAAGTPYFREGSIYIPISGWVDPDGKIELPGMLDGLLFCHVSMTYVGQINRIDCGYVSAVTHQNPGWSILTLTNPHFWGFDFNTFPVYIIFTAPEHYFTPNVFIAQPTWVVAEADSSYPTEHMRTVAPVKAFYRTSEWGAPLSWAGMPYPKDLPVMLTPGYWGFRMQNTDWGESTAGYWFNTAARRFHLTFEKPKMWIDLAANRYMESVPATIPINWGLSPEAGSARDTIKNSVVEYQHVVRACGEWAGYMAVTTIEPTQQNDTLWSNHTKILKAGVLQITLDGYECSSIMQVDDGLLLGLIDTRLSWSRTGIVVEHKVDTHQGFAYIPVGAATDYYSRGTGGLNPMDLIGLLPQDAAQQVPIPNPGSPWLRVENTETVPRDLTSVGHTLDMWLLVRCIGGTDAEDFEFVKIKNYPRHGGLYHLSQKGVLTLIHPCIISTADIAEGQELAWLDSGKPAGYPMKARRLVDNSPDESTVWVIDLPKGNPYAVPTVALANNVKVPVTHISLREPDDPLPAPAINEIYYIDGRGDDGLEAALVISPDLADTELYVDYQTWGEDYYISHITKNNGIIYFCEYGSGKWYQYDGAAKTVALISCVKFGDKGIAALTSDGNNLWAITESAGQLAKFGTEWTGHIDQFNGYGLTVPAALGSLAAASGSVCEVNPDGTARFGSRNASGSITIAAPDIIYPALDYNTEPEFDTVEVSYTGGTVKAGNSRARRQMGASCVTGKGQAQVIADLSRALDTAQQVTVSVPLEIDIDLRDELVLPYISADGFTGEIRSQVLAISPDYKAQRQSIALRRLADETAVTP